ncbi:MAG: S16 family serine protease [Verrucomicrobiota bacterium]
MTAYPLRIPFALFFLSLCPALLLFSQDVSIGPPAPAKSGSGTMGTAEAHMVAYFTRGDGTVGGVARPFSVRVIPTAEKRASVGVMQEFYGGTGNMWNTAAWIAAFNASALHGSTIVDHEFILKVSGRVDGPSAGMISTVAFLAALRGDPMIPTATMTGTINPDGTCGPVGGIPQKMEGAKEQGMTKFGYPIGARTSIDMATELAVDLNAKAESLGMEAKEIRDIYDAYHFLTGIRLDRPQAAYESDLDLSTGLRTKVQGWMLRTQASVDQRFGPLAQLAQNNEFVLQTMGAVIAEIATDIEEAQAFERSSMVIPAYSRYMQADAMSRACEVAIEGLEAIGANNMEVLNGHFSSSQRNCNTRLSAFILQARASFMNPKLGSQVDALSNMSLYAQAFGHFEEGVKRQQSFNQIAQNYAQLVEQNGAEAVTAQLFMDFLYGILYYEIAGVLVDFAEDWISLESNKGPDNKLTPEKLQGFARAYASAGSACVSYFDAVITEPYAQQLGMNLASFRSQLAVSEPMYPIAVTLSDPTRFGVGTAGGDPMEAAFLHLGAGSVAYLMGASLVNKHYSLGAQMKEDGTFVLSNKRALGAMIDRAKQRALEEAGAFEAKFGFIPDSVRMNFQLATGLREGDDVDKLEALQAYWSCAQLCEVAGQLAQE